jgi:hypothetical protein
MTDNDIAIWLLALEEEPLRPWDFRDSIASAFERNLAAPHDGDCTDECYSCARCRAETALAEAAVVREVFGIPRPGK